MKNAFFILFLSLLTSLLSVWVYHSYFKTRTGYIEIKKVFNGFQMKKELEDKFKQVTEVKQRLIDSLSFNLKLMSKQINELNRQNQKPNADLVAQFEYKRDEFLKLKNQYSEDNSVLSQKYDAQILERLTQYVIEYGKNNNYDIIFGADGNGSLMFAKDNYNISEQMIEFINNKYSGK